MNNYKYHLEKYRNSGQKRHCPACSRKRFVRYIDEQGEVAAQGNLGELYEKGIGVEADTVEAIKWYKLAAAKGLAEAQEALAKLEKPEPDE